MHMMYGNLEANVKAFSRRNIKSLLSYLGQLLKMASLIRHRILKLMALIIIIIDVMELRVGYPYNI